MLCVVYLPCVFVPFVFFNFGVFFILVCRVESYSYNFLRVSQLFIFADLNVTATITSGDACRSKKQVSLSLYEKSFCKIFTLKKNYLLATALTE